MPYPLEFANDGSPADRNFLSLAKDMNPPVPQARVFNSAAITTTSGATKILTFDSERFDNGSLHSTSANTSRLTAPITGAYLFGCHVEFAANAVGRRQVGLKLNGTTYLGFDVRQAVAVAAITTLCSISSLHQLVAGDYVEVEAFQDSGGNLNVTANADYTPELWMVRLGGYVNQGV